MIAICFVPVVHEFVDLALGTYCVRHILGFRETRPLKDYGLYLPLALLACSPAFLLCRVTLSDWAALPATILLSTGLYYLLLRRNDNMQELVRIVRERELV